jgi:hypothetical protein
MQKFVVFASNLPSARKLSSPHKTSILSRHGSTTTSAKHSQPTSCCQRNDRSRKRPSPRTSRRTTLISRRSLLTYCYVLITVSPRYRGDAHSGGVYDGDARNGDAYNSEAYNGDAHNSDAHSGGATMVKERDGWLDRWSRGRRGRERRK